MVSVVGGGVARDLSIDVRRSTPARVFQILDQQDRASFAGKASGGALIEGAIDIRTG
jgi:hypothetical protein